MQLKAGCDETTPSNGSNETPDNECLLSACHASSSATHATPTCMEKVGLANREEAAGLVQSSCGEVQRSTCESDESAEPGQSSNELPVCNGEVGSVSPEESDGVGVVTEKAKECLSKAEKQDTLSKENSLDEEELSHER